MIKNTMAISYLLWKSMYHFPVTKRDAVSFALTVTHWCRPSQWTCRLQSRTDRWYSWRRLHSLITALTVSLLFMLHLLPHLLRLLHLPAPCPAPPTLTPDYWAAGALLPPAVSPSCFLSLLPPHTRTSGSTFTLFRLSSFCPVLPSHKVIVDVHQYLFFLFYRIGTCISFDFFLL